ncbi:MAG: hypothetical protein IJ642_03790 [Oscillospiraceae bacterium]|nr:hypothetical protein [Oscillospiraceae bacterium]
MTGTKKQKTEALLRLRELTKAFNLNPEIIRCFQEDKLYYSYLASGTFGCIDTINYDPSYAGIVQKFEQETGSLVYHAVETENMYGKLLSLLYVSNEKYKDEWNLQRLEKEYIASYVWNINENFGEYGDIFLTSDNGALLRKA